MRRLRDESGFTVIELMMASSIGLVVLFAAFMLLDRAFVSSSTVADRQDALQRGRQAMDDITRQVRSEVCLNPETTPMLDARDDTMTFYADLGDGSAGRPPQKHTLLYDPSTRQIRELVYVPTGTPPNNLVFPAAPTRTRVLLTDAKARSDVPVFRYYAFRENDTSPGANELLPTPLTLTDAERTVRVGVSFVSHPSRGQAPAGRTATLENDIYVRSADPTRPKEGPRCL